MPNSSAQTATGKVLELEALLGGRELADGTPFQQNLLFVLVTFNTHTTERMPAGDYVEDY